MRIFLIFITLISFSLFTFAQDDKEDCEFEVSKKSKKLFKKAIEELKLGNYNGGTNYLQDAIEDTPDYLRALWVLADLNQRKTNRHRKESIAFSSYNAIVELCPSYRNYYSYYYLGKMYYDNEKWQEASDNFELFLNADTEKIHDKHFEDAVDLSKYAKFYASIYSNPVPFKPVIVSDVSSSDGEYLPSLSPDNDFLYFTRGIAIAANARVKNYRAGEVEEKFCIAKRTGKNKFELGVPMPFPFNEQSNEGGATITINNKELFYTRCIIANKALNCDICYAKYEDGYWSDIEVLGTEVNTPKYWESMPSISSDGNTLYFVSNRPGGYGGHDIYRSTRDTSGKWNTAINMGPGINTAGNEKSPFIHTDSQTLYFSSADRQDRETREWFAGHMGLGGFDIFYTRLNDSNLWITPKNIGYPINSESNDLGFFVSTDGKYGFYAAKRESLEVQSNGKKKKPIWNIYSFELYQKARPQKVLFVKGNLKDEITSENIRDAKIVIKNVETKEIKEVAVNNETGDYVFAMVMKSDYTMTVKKRDYTYVTRYISKSDTKFDVPISMDMELKPIQVGKTYNLKDIYFDIDSEYLTETSKKVVEGFYEFLKDNPSIKVEIQGHTDNVGADSYNMTLSNARARTVYQLLIRLGIPASQMKYKGYGESKPVDDNDTEEGRAKNRRTVFLILSK